VEIPKVELEEARRDAALDTSSSTGNVESEVKGNEKELVKGVSGCGLIVDYGADNVHADSFRVRPLNSSSFFPLNRDHVQAFKNHKIVDPFYTPGECDLTANVDFAYLKESMGGLVHTHGPLTQGAFLTRMGLGLRLEGLVKAAKDGERKKIIEDAGKRLVDMNGMGKEYKILGVSSFKAAEGEKEEVVWPFVPESDVD